MNKKMLQIGLGVVGGLVGGKLLSSQKAKEFAVSTVASGLKWKESVDKTVEKVRENTNDIVAEAKVKKAEDEQLKREREMQKDLAAIAAEKELLEEEQRNKKEEKIDEKIKELEEEKNNFN